MLKLRQVEVLQGQGKSVSEAVRQIGVTIQTYYRWRKEYGGMTRDQLKRLKELETENQRLRRAVSDLTLDKMILAEAAKTELKPQTRTRSPHDRQASNTRFDNNPGCDRGYQEASDRTLLRQYGSYSRAGHPRQADAMKRHCHGP